MASETVYADISLSPLFSDHMVLQRNQSNRVWGWGEPAEKATLHIGDQSKPIVVASDGRWEVYLEPLATGGPYTLRIEGEQVVEIKDVLVGEVWLCSGQSNMEWNIRNSRDPDLEANSAHYPMIRHITVPRYASETPLERFNGKWEVCNPESIGEFSAVGYHFGRRLHQTIGVPIGLIDNSWGGSTAEAWTPLDVLESDEYYKPLLARWDKQIETYDPDAARKKYNLEMEKWETGGQTGSRPRAPLDPRKSHHRPANLYNGVLNPIIGYGMRGAIWYQGESNVDRAYQYRELFPLMIQSWRDAWGQGDFPFYYVQLAGFMSRRHEPKESEWAELREAQSKTQGRLPNLGQAIAIDAGEANNIHPKDKQTIANRLARWALANDYGIDVAYQSPTFRSMEIVGNSVILSFDNAEKGLFVHDFHEIHGFAIAGENRDFIWANAEIIEKNKIRLWARRVPNPVAARYGWANNPVANVRSKERLPLAPFRTDDWPGLTSDKR